MIRLVGAMITLLCLLPPAAGSLDRQKSIDRPVVIPLGLPKGIPPATTDVPPPAEAQLTSETEVFLDGRKCQYKDLPATASITRMVLAEDGKTITRVEFHTKK